MNPESFEPHVWYRWTGEAMQPCDPPSVKDEAAIAEREQRARAMSTRQVHTRRQQMKVVSR